MTNTNISYPQSHNNHGLTLKNHLEFDTNFLQS